MQITLKFKKIYNILECWTILIEDIKNPDGVDNNSFWNYGNINIVFLRILYTLKMIGDPRTS
jgi:ribosomal protein L5